MKNNTTSLTKLIESLKRDNRIVLAGYYGSHAFGNASDFSDIDIFIVIKSSQYKSAEGLHFQPENGIDIDFIFIPENFIHDKKLSKYTKRCILANNKIIFSKCDSCRNVVTKFRTKTTNHEPVFLEETENIYWHLKHIIRKARKYKNDAVEIQVLWAKFIYFLALLLPRLNSKLARGELEFVSKSYGKDLELFIKQNRKKIPQLSLWKDFLDSMPIFAGIREKSLFREIDGMIQPYTPPENDYMKSRYYGLVSKWLKL